MFKKKNNNNNNKNNLLFIIECINESKAFVLTQKLLHYK